MSDRIRGFCPMGCGDTLFIADGGYITCSWHECPNPTAVAELLEDREVEHVVRFDEHAFTVRHPIRERLNDELLACELHQFCGDLPGPPVKPGRYRAVAKMDAGWSFFALGGSS